MIKEQQIRVEIIPQLRSIADKLWDAEQNLCGRKLDIIIDELTNILDKEND